jgi:hypothetical protein
MLCQILVNILFRFWDIFHLPNIPVVEWDICSVNILFLWEFLHPSFISLSRVLSLGLMVTAKGTTRKLPKKLKIVKTYWHHLSLESTLLMPLSFSIQLFPGFRREHFLKGTLVNPGLEQTISYAHIFSKSKAWIGKYFFYYVLSGLADVTGKNPNTGVE